jgi:hypothetical protein
MFVVNGPLSHMTFFCFIAYVTEARSGGQSAKEEETKADVPVIPLTWGSGRSFADVLKKEEASS